MVQRHSYAGKVEKFQNCYWLQNNAHPTDGGFANPRADWSGRCESGDQMQPLRVFGLDREVAGFDSDPGPGSSLVPLLRVRQLPRSWRVRKRHQWSTLVKERMSTGSPAALPKLANLIDRSSRPGCQR